MAEDEEFEATSQVAIFVHSVGEQRTVGVACRAQKKRTSMGDSVRNELIVYQFPDGAQLSNVESLLVRLAPQCAYIAKDAAAKGDAKKLRQVLEAAEVPADEVARAHFAERDVEPDMCKLLGVESSARFGATLMLQVGMRAMAALVKSLDLVSDDGELGRYTLSQGQLDAFMRLDAPAVQALSLLPGPRDPNRFCSLAGVLDHCVTQRMGTRLLHRWLRQPLTDLDAIRWRHDMVELFAQDTMLRDALRDEGLKSIPDLDRMSRRLEAAAAGKGSGGMSLEHLYRLYKVAQRLPDIRGQLEAHSGPHAATLKKDFADALGSLEGDLRGYAEMIEQVMDMEAVHRIPAQFLISPKWSSDLAEIARQRDEARDSISDLYEEGKRSWGRDLEDLKCEEERVRGFVFRTKKANDKIVRTIPKVEILAVQKAGVLFTTGGPGGLRALASAHSEHERAYAQEQQKLVAKAVAVAATYVPVFEAVSRLIAELDVLVSFAHAAVSTPSAAYVRPAMLPRGQGSIRVQRARHPCLELQEGVYYIPNDYTLDREKSRLAMITGPNMGGKSTYIRAMGVLAVMAQVGAFVPADAAEFPVLDAVLARVGAGDAQSRGISTFMAEMLEASAILQAATADSLVIVDELGRGTSTYDGFGLAWAISEYLAKQVQCFCLFATHFHELTALAKVPGAAVANLHVTAHTTSSSITMLYEVREGACDRSFGIHVAELAQFPEEVIRAAKRKASELEGFEAQEEEEAEAGDEQPRKRRALPPGLRTADEGKISQFLQAFSALPLDAMSQDDASRTIKNLASQFQLS